MRDHRVDQPVAAAVRDVVLGEAEPQQVARVVAQPQVGLRELARRRPRDLGVGLDHDRELRRDQHAGPDALARERRVLGRREVRVGAERPLGGEIEHLRAERGGEALIARDATGIEPVEVLAHRLQRPRVVAGRLRMADPDPEQEPVAELGTELGVAARDVGGLVLPDVEDAGNDGQRAARLEVRPRLVQRRAAAQPQRPVAERLDLRYDAGAAFIAAVPDSDPSEVHSGRVAGSGSRRRPNARNQPATPPAISAGISGRL